MPVKQMKRTFRDPDYLSEPEQKIMALAKKGLTPREMAPYFPTWQYETVRRYCKKLRERGFEVPFGAGFKREDESPGFDTDGHLKDLKRAGYTVFLYRLNCEYRMKPGGGDRALAPPLNFSSYGSPAAMCEAS